LFKKFYLINSEKLVPEKHVIRKSLLLENVGVHKEIMRLQEVKALKRITLRPK